MSIFYITVCVICGIYMILNFKYDIQMFQQNSYRIPRLWKWLRQSGNYSSGWRLVDLACIFLLLSTLLVPSLSGLFVALVALTKIFLIFRKKYKKPLVFTKRVWRLYSVTAVLALGAFVGAVFGFRDYETVFNSYAPTSVSLSVLFLITAFSYIPLILADIILMPVEKMIGRRYINDAKRILRSMPSLKIIGITGSYGKTSTKHYLQRILSEQFDVLITPGSFNTPMGVVRTIREYLKPYNEVFICEMGAKQKNDIKEICDIVHPDAGIITAVGPMHLESFKTIENVQSTKFELADAIPADGFVAINNDFEYCANREVSNTRAIRYGVTSKAGCDYRAVNIRYTPNGTAFTIEGPEGLSFDVETRLLGECNVSDLLAAAVTALQLGVSTEKIRYAIGAIQQVEHRLSIKQTPGGITILDDAFNSNPEGSRMAVEVLSQFTDGKRIIVTPGMIELGDRQFELNKELGRRIGENLDVAVIVGEYNREALVEGIKSTDFAADRLHIVSDFNEAQRLLSTMLAKGDTVLYENDLPDTFK